MTDTNKLAELIKKAKSKMWGKTFHSELERNMFVADYLLANGVIVPQCNFKDTIYRIGSKSEIYGDWELMYIQVYPDEILYIDDSDNYFTAEDIGKTVFLTKEEAEKALERSKGN